MQQRLFFCLLFTLAILILFPASTWSQHQEEHEHKDMESHKSGEQHSMPMGEGEGSVMMMEHESKYPLVPWKTPDASIFPPPPLMGKQIGQVHTLNVPPLGYEMDGDVKVFNLTVQPVERYLTDGRMPNESIIKEWNRFIGGMHHNVPKKVKLWGYNGSVPGPTIEAVEIALINNRALQSAFEEIGISKADLVQAGLFHNPGLGMLFRFPFDRDGTNIELEGGFVLSDLWQMPFRRKVAAAQMDVTIMRVSQVVLDTLMEAKLAYEKDAEGSEVLGPGVGLQIPIFDQNRASIDGAKTLFPEPGASFGRKSSVRGKG